MVASDVVFTPLRVVKNCLTVHRESIVQVTAPVTVIPHAQVFSLRTGWSSTALLWHGMAVPRDWCDSMYVVDTCSALQWGYDQGSSHAQ